MNFAQIPILSGSAGFHPFYKAVLAEAISQGDTLPSYQWQTRQNALVVDLVRKTIWSKSDFLYNFYHDGGESFSYINWKSPANNRITKNGTITFTTLDGSKGDGSTGYYLTHFQPNTHGVNWTLNEAGFFIDVKESAQEDIYICGVQDGGNSNRVRLRPRSTSDQADSALNSTSSSLLIVSNTDASGLFHVKRTSSTDTSMFRNGSSLGSTTSDLSNARPTIDIAILALNNASVFSSFSAKTFRLFGGGGSLAGLESELYNSWIAYKTI